MKRLRHTFLFILVWAVFLNGCSTWKVLEQPPEATSYEYARLILKDGRVIEIKEAHVREDAIVGLGKRTDVYWDLPITFPLQDIQDIETRQANVGGTVLIIVGTVVVLGAIAGAVAVAAWDGPFGTP